MKRITLNNLTIANFKGVKSFSTQLDGEDATVTAKNGIGKTTLYDAVLWLFFGKDSTGRKEFELRPLDRRNNQIKGVVVSVESEINVDGVLHNFKKEHHEKIVRKQLRGYETLHWIDEVPHKAGEYAEYITKIISEEIFKLLTDLHFFNAKMHRKERRAVLLEIVGEIGEPEGFEELIVATKGRPIDKFKTVLTDRKKAYDKERAEINPRIDELLLGLEHPAEDTKGLALKRDGFKAAIEKLRIIREDINKQGIRRVSIQTKIANLTKQKAEREGILTSDMSGVQKLLDEKAQIARDVAKAEQLVDAAENEQAAVFSKMLTKEDERARLLREVDRIRGDRERAEETTSSKTCYACNQDLPAEKLKEVEAQKQSILDLIEKSGKESQGKVDEISKLIGALESNRKLLLETHEKAKTELTEAREHAEARLLEIAEAIKTRPTISPEDDEVWDKITNEIEGYSEELGEPVEDQLTAIEKEKTTAESELTTINEALAQADRMVKDRARIKVLEAKEVELAQSIADVEKMLSTIEQYKAQQSTMITNVVNELFEVVEFKMFNELLNGGLEECCEAVLKGVPYPDMSKGEEIYVGLDITNVLSEHYGYSVPVFIDNSESYGMSLRSNSQAIWLKFIDGQKELKIEKSETSKRKVEV